MNKLKFMGKNSIFNLRINIYISEDHIIGTATGTAMTLKALPIPQPIEIKIDKYFKQRDLHNMAENMFEEIDQISKSNIDLNFRMPIF